jgi:hypothetical protein
MVEKDELKVVVVAKEKPDTFPYTDEALRRIFDFCRNQDETELLTLFHRTGMRSGEVAHAHFTNLIPSKNGSGGFLEVKEKPDSTGNRSPRTHTARLRSLWTYGKCFGSAGHGSRERRRGSSSPPDRSGPATGCSGH